LTGTRVGDGGGVTGLMRVGEEGMRSSVRCAPTPSPPYPNTPIANIDAVRKGRGEVSDADTPGEP
jgi:hypothetical protein